jgi:hypothetical protein
MLLLVSRIIQLCKSRRTSDDRTGEQLRALYSRCAPSSKCCSSSFLCVEKLLTHVAAVIYSSNPMGLSEGLRRNQQ